MTFTRLKTTKQLEPEHKGRRVLYVPKHAKGNPEHPDCELGNISSWNLLYVFVRYDGELQPKATEPKYLYLTKQ